MATDTLQEQIASMRKSFFDEGHLDKQFVEMEKMQDSDNPDFLEECITMFFEDSATIFEKVDLLLEKPRFDFDMLEKTLHQYKGTNATIGAHMLFTECNVLRECLKAHEIQRARALFKKLKEDHDALKNKLEAYFQLIKQAAAAVENVKQTPAKGMFFGCLKSPFACLG